MQVFADFDWSKPKKGNVNTALQIQYFVTENAQWQKVQVQAINVWEKDKTKQNSGLPTSFPMELFSLLKYITVKQWILAFFVESPDSKKLPGKLSLLLRLYILYYEKILDAAIMDSDISYMEKWLNVKFTFKGFYTSEYISKNKNAEGDLDGDITVEVVKDSADPWKLTKIYNMVDIWTMKDSTKLELLQVVCSWLEDHFATPQKKKK